MNKGLTAIILVALLVLFLVGCKAPEEAPEDETGAAEEGTLTGDITEVDNLDSEINEEELEDIDSSLDEITW